MNVADVAQVLYRDSSNLDGVQSRGAGWHSREVPGSNETQRLERLTGELARGDLVRPSGKLGKLWVHDGQGLLTVAPVSQSRSDHRSTESALLAESSDGDWPVFWNTNPDAAGLLQAAPVLDATRWLRTAAACDLAETGLRFVPEGEEAPRRAVVAMRRWLVGAERFEVVKSASSAAYAAYSTNPAAYAAIYGAVDATYAATYAAASAARSAGNVNYAVYAANAAFHAASASASAAYAAAAASRAAADVYVAISRSLSFLVRVRIPLWQVCLAAAEGSGT